MTEDYKIFMRHAKKLTNSDAAKTRLVLKGVKHFVDGSLAVTDSHRLYLVEDIHDKGETLLTPDGKKIDERYPNIHRLIPDRGVGNVTMTINVNEMLKGTEIILTANTAAGVDSPMYQEKNELRMDIPETIVAKYKLPEDYALTEGFEIASNAKYWVDGLKLFKAFKYEEIKLEFHGRMRPFTMYSPDDKLMVLILPVRTY